MNFKSVSKLELHECLMYLSFEKEKNQIEADMIKKAYRK